MFNPVCSVEAVIFARDGLVSSAFADSIVLDTQNLLQRSTERHYQGLALGIG